MEEIHNISSDSLEVIHMVYKEGRLEDVDRKLEKKSDEIRVSSTQRNEPEKSFTNIKKPSRYSRNISPKHVQNLKGKRSSNSNPVPNLTKEKCKKGDRKHALTNTLRPRNRSYVEIFQEKMKIAGLENIEYSQSSSSLTLSSKNDKSISFSTTSLSSKESDSFASQENNYLLCRRDEQSTGKVSPLEAGARTNGSERMTFKYITEKNRTIKNKDISLSYTKRERLLLSNKVESLGLEYTDNRKKLESFMKRISYGNFMSKNNCKKVTSKNKFQKSLGRANNKRNDSVIEHEEKDKKSHSMIKLDNESKTNSNAFHTFKRENKKETKTLQNDSNSSSTVCNQKKRKELFRNKSKTVDRVTVKEIKDVANLNLKILQDRHQREVLLAKKIQSELFNELY